MTEFVGNRQNVDFSDPKTVILADLMCQQLNSVPTKILVVGCGKGIEAAVLAQYLGASVTGIDIVTDFNARAGLFADLRRGDATGMEFADESFDFVYSFHALEHIPDFRAALREMRRVLRPAGGWMIGTPNSKRIVGYLGSKDASVTAKLKWNFADWNAKLHGRFRNELGAHAGYTKEELRGELANVFSTVSDITLDYYRDVYSSKRGFIDAMAFTGASTWLFPCIYFLGKR
ncbi:MAG: methyltransferase domain-containing protein [Gammaproteobacteria bacterium]|nr:MAG: methyltransferase domain-containing protein [Gammaproteobacteria bacterium]